MRCADLKQTLIKPNTSQMSRVTICLSFVWKLKEFQHNVQAWSATLFMKKTDIERAFNEQMRARTQVA